MATVQLGLGEHGWLLGAEESDPAAPATLNAGATASPGAGGSGAPAPPWTAWDAWGMRATSSGASSPDAGGPLLRPAAAAADGPREQPLRAPPPYVRVAAEAYAQAAPGKSVAASASPPAAAVWACVQAWLLRPARLEEVVARLEALLVEAEGWLVADEDAQAAALYRGMVAVCHAQGLGVRATLLRASTRHGDPLLLALRREGAEQSAQVLLAAIGWSWASLGTGDYVAALDARLRALGRCAHRRVARGHDAAAVEAIECMAELQRAGAALLGRHRRPLADYLLPELGAGLAVVAAGRHGCRQAQRTLLRRDPATARAYLQHLEEDLLDALHARRLDLAGRRQQQIEALAAAAPCGPPSVHYVAALGAWTRLRPLAADGRTPAAPGAPCRLALWPDQLEAALPGAPGQGPQTVFGLAVCLGLRLSALAVAQEGCVNGPVHVFWPAEAAATRWPELAAAAHASPALVAWALQHVFVRSAGEACDLSLTPATVRVLAQALLMQTADAPGGAPYALAFLSGLRRRAPQAPAALRRLTLDVDVCARLTPQLRDWIDGVR